MNDPQLTKLMRELVSADADRAAADREYKVIEQECIRFMEERGTFDTFEDAGVTLKLTKIQEYNKSLDGPLRPLMELLDPESIESMLTNPKPPKRQFLIPKLKQWAKLEGNVFTSAIEAAKTTVRKKITINYNPK